MQRIANNQLTSGQMAGLLFAFMTGSSIIYVPGAVISIAHNNAWISLLIALGDCLLMVAAILWLHRLQGGMNFVAYSRDRLGVVVTVLLALPFALYLTIMISWITMGVSEFMTSTSMRNTPPYLFNGLILATAAMTVRSGIEVMTRLSILLFAILLLLLGGVLVLSIPNMTVSFIKPVLQDGWMPVLHGSYFLYGFPFGEVIIFTLLLPYARREKAGKLAWRMAAAVVLNGLLLLSVVLTTIMMFGPVAAEMKFSLYSVSRLIDVAEFFQRIESVIGISMIAGSYVKTTIALFALNELWSRLFRSTDEKLLVFPAAAVCYLLTLTMFEYDAEFFEKFTIFWPFLNLILAASPLLVSGIIALFRR